MDTYDDGLDWDYDEANSDENTQLQEIFSAGFSDPVDEDPFNLQGSLSPSESLHVEPEPDAPQVSKTNTNDDSNNKKVESDHHHATVKQSKVALKKSKTLKHGMSTKKSFKILKPPRAHSNESLEQIDPEEEKLKMLPDCCEFTVRKNDAYEADDSRKTMSSAWFHKIKLNPVQQKQLCFSESLLLVEETGAVVGKMYCSVTPAKWNDKPCLCVHSGSFGKFSTGLESGTSITSFVNYNLKAVQEFVHEWATLESETIERKTLMVNEGEAMPCKIQFIRNGKTIDTKSIVLGFVEVDSLVTEATNILLHRLLIQDRRTNGNMNLLSLSYTGKVVKAKYAELGSGWENVRGKQMKTWGIRRTVFVSEEEERVWDSLHNKYSRLILRCQPDSPQALIPLWFESIVDFDKHGNFTGVYSPYAWACDMELYSRYSIKKEEVTHENRRYIMDHPEVRALLSDYLQAVLFRKPQNVIEFTKQYFESFVPVRGRSTKSMLHLGSSSSASSSSYGSSMTMSDEGLGEGEGEWFGEGEDGHVSFYPVNPTVNYGGLEKVDDGMGNQSEGDIGTTENETEDDLVVNEEGDYVHEK